MPWKEQEVKSKISSIWTAKRTNLQTKKQSLGDFNIGVSPEKS